VVFCLLHTRRWIESKISPIVLYSSLFTTVHSRYEMNSRISSRPCPPRNSIGRKSHTSHARPLSAVLFCLRALALYHNVPGCIYMCQRTITLWFSSARFGVCYVTSRPVQGALKSELVVIAASFKTTHRVWTTRTRSEREDS
jgi:hypothetical protein